MYSSKRKQSYHHLLAKLMHGNAWNQYKSEMRSVQLKGLENTNYKLSTKLQDNDLISNKTLNYTKG